MFHEAKATSKNTSAGSQFRHKQVLMLSPLSGVPNGSTMICNSLPKPLFSSLSSLSRMLWLKPGSLRFHAALHIFDGPNRFPKVSPRVPPNFIRILENQIRGVECFFPLVPHRQEHSFPQTHTTPPKQAFFAGRPPPARGEGGVAPAPFAGVEGNF